MEHCPIKLASAIERNPNRLRIGTLLPARVEHWDTIAFHDFLLDRASLPFVWGQQDCALFAADGIVALTGVDIAEDFRGKYHDEESAFALIHEVTGGSTIEEAAAWCAAKHQMPEHTFPLMAQRGDLVVLENAGRLISGLVHLSGRHVVASGEEGLVRISISKIKRAWHV